MLATKSLMQVSVEGIDLFHSKDHRATINALKYFLTICDRKHVGITTRELSRHYGQERHTSRDILKRLEIMGLITIEEVNHMHKPIHLTQEGWELYLEMSV